MVRIAAINYLNTIPFIYGLEARMAPGTIAMQFCTPAESARMLLEDKADVGITPVAVIPSLKDPHIVSDFCIGATGKVASVLACSGRPIREVKEIRLDVDSRTSVLLLRWLCREKWHIAPRFVPFDFTREPLDPSQCYLPFVFAAWTANKPLDSRFIESFNQALEYGIRHIPEAVEKYDHQFPRDYACTYLRDNISFPFDSEKRAGLTEFWRVALEKLTPRECVL